MNKEYVENLELYQYDEIDWNFVRKKASELIYDSSFPKGLIEYAIDNLIEALKAYFDDYDFNKTYYTVEFGNKKRTFYFHIRNLAHLLGLHEPNFRYLNYYNYIVSTKEDKDVLLKLKDFFENSKNRNMVINQDSSDTDKAKLNWDKVAVKTFCFLNMGIFTEGDTICLEKESEKGHFVMVRDLITQKNLGCLIIHFESKMENEEEVLTPTSIELRDEDRTSCITNLKNNGYIIRGYATIKKIEEKMNGGQYGKK